MSWSGNCWINPMFFFLHVRLFFFFFFKHVCHPDTKGLPLVHSGPHRGERADLRIHSMNVL